MDCPRCGEFNSMTSKRCASCGARMKARRAERAPEPLLPSPDESRAEAFEPEPGRPPLVSPWRVSALLAGLVAAGLAHLAEAISAIAFAAAFPGRTAPLTPFAPSTPWVSILVTLGAAITFFRWIVPFQRDLFALSGDRRVRMSPYFSFLLPFYSLIAPLWLMQRQRTALDAALALLPPPRPEAIDYRSHERLLERAPAPPGVERWFAAWTAMWAVPLLAGAFGRAPYAAAIRGMIGATAAALAVAMVLAFDDGLREAERRARALHDEDVPAFPSFSDNGLVHGAQTGTIAGLHAVLVVGTGAAPGVVSPWPLLVGGVVWVVARRVRPRARVQVALAAAVVALVGGGFWVPSRLLEITAASKQLRMSVEGIEALVEAPEATRSQRDAAFALLADARRISPEASRADRAIWLCRGERAVGLRDRVAAWVGAMGRLNDLEGVYLTSVIDLAALDARQAAIAEARRAVEDHERFIADIPRATQACLAREGATTGWAAVAALGVEGQTRQGPSRQELKRRGRELDEMSAALAILARESGRYTVADGAPVFVDPAAQSEWDQTMDRLDKLDGD